MARRADTTPSTASGDRLAWLDETLREVADDRANAREAGSWSAVAALHRQSQSLRGEYDTEVERLAREAAEQQEDAELTPEEIQRMLFDGIAEAETETLLACAMEWARRSSYRLLVDDRGVVRLEPVLRSLG